MFMMESTQGFFWSPCLDRIPLWIFIYFKSSEFGVWTRMITVGRHHFSCLSALVSDECRTPRKERWRGGVGSSHPRDGVDSQDGEAFGHDGRRGFTEQNPRHVDLHHLTCRHKQRFHRYIRNTTKQIIVQLELILTLNVFFLKDFELLNVLKKKCAKACLALKRAKQDTKMRWRRSEKEEERN